jgi:hypothetical protein
MSHAIGAARLADGRILFFEYDAGVERALPTLHESEEAVRAVWRQYRDTTCTCPTADSHVRVELATPYADGSHWGGEACLNCMVITTGTDPDEGDASVPDSPAATYRDGLPAWSPWEHAYADG